MSAEYTNLIHVPGITGRVVVDADYNWTELGELLADGFDGEQAELINSLAVGLRRKESDGLMQLQYVADLLRGDTEDYDKEGVIWFLRELLIRVGGEA